MLDEFWDTRLTALKAAAEAKAAGKPGGIRHEARPEETFIDAPVAIVYQLLTDPAKLVRWLADEVEIDAGPAASCAGATQTAMCAADGSSRPTCRTGSCSPRAGSAEVQIPPGSTTVDAAAANTRRGHPRGCLLITAATNCSPQSADIQVRLRNLRTTFAKALQRNRTNSRYRPRRIARPHRPPGTGADLHLNPYSTDAEILAGIQTLDQLAEWRSPAPDEAATG